MITVLVIEWNNLNFLNGCRKSAKKNHSFPKVREVNPLVLEDYSAKNLRALFFVLWSNLTHLIIMY